MKSKKYLIPHLKPGAPGSLKPIFLMEKYEIQKLRELPIEGVAERLGLTVSHHKALCPFHDDSHPSLSFKTSTNTYRCFVCGAHGGPIDLALHLLPSGRSGRGSFLEACQWLADEHNVILASESTRSRQDVDSLNAHRSTLNVSCYSRFFEHPFLSDAARHFLYEERHLDPRVVSWCRLNSYRDRNGVNWLQIPYYSIDGQLIGVQSRNLDYKKDSLDAQRSSRDPRFKFPQGSQCHIYNLPVVRMLQPGEPLYIAEGCSDCWALLSAGHKAIAIPSATLLKPEDLQVLKQFTPSKSSSQALSSPYAMQLYVLPLGKSRLGERAGGEALSTPTLHIYPDRDFAGDQLYRQLLSLATSLGCCLIRHDLPPDCKDYADYWRKHLKPEPSAHFKDTFPNG